MDSQMVSKENGILIRLEDVWKIYKMGEVEVPALKGVSVEMALSGNPVISVMVSWMHNNAKDVKTEIDNTLCAFLVKLKNNNEKDAMAQRAKVSVCISLGFSVVPNSDSIVCE